MKKEITILSIVALLAFAFAAYNSACVIIHKKRMAYTTGTVVSIFMPVPETSKARNSKWAYMSYTINGKKYTSDNRIQVPMSAEIGTQIRICYDKKAPEKLFTFSVKRIIISLILCLFCIIIMIIKVIGRR